MAFIRRRMFPEERRKGRWKAAPRYQLVQTFREGGKVKQRVASLGEHPTVEEALHAFRQRVASLEKTVEKKKTQGPGYYGGRYRRGPPNLKMFMAMLAYYREKLARLESVVSTTSVRNDILDTTAPRRRSTSKS
jgi:hypothetical protein